MLTPFGKLCADARTHLTMTRPELARHVNTTPRDISDIELGKKPVPALYASLVTGILGLDPVDVEMALSTPDSPYRLTRITQPKYGS